MPSRRDVLASLLTAGAVATAGCTSGDETADGTETTSPPTGEQSPTTETSREPTAETTSQRPADCRSLPDVDGLPDAPDEWGVDRAESYASEFERAYVPVTDDRATGVASLQVTRAEAADGSYVVEVDVEVATDAGDGTQTEQPQDATEHRARYVLAADRVVRQRRGVAANRLIDEDCWRLPGSDA
ncbi:hypothetical protein [Halobacterium yunchengense]|uniref:hypothetical protein n=1 Tax=Halobacterium yunchengense TaxID=3108497 RepID=UPI00300A68DC